jgi:hypothetical protein
LDTHKRINYSHQVPNNLAAVKKTAERVNEQFITERRSAMETRDLRTGIVMNGYPRDRFAAQIGSSSSNSGGIINANSSSSVNGLSTVAAPGSGGGDSPHGRTDWEADETLEAYIQNLQARRK